MNPEEQKQNGSTPQPNADLNAEGVEIMSGQAEDTEFERNTPPANTESEGSNPGQELNLDEEPKTALESDATGSVAPESKLSNLSDKLMSAPEPEPAPAYIPDPAPEPTPQQKFGQPSNIYKQSEPVEEKPKVQNDPSIKAVRTFKSDAEEAVKYQNVSAIDIALAEHKKKESLPPQPKKASNSQGMFVVIAILIMIVLGGGWYYWFISSQDTVEPNPVPTSIKTILPYAKGSTVFLEQNSDPLVLISSKLASSNAGLGNIYALIPTNSPSGTTTKYAPIEQIFENTRIPSKLLRSLRDDYMFGSYTYDANGAFIILKGTYFQNMFSGMLEWEKDMRSDLIDLIRVSSPNEPDFASSTAFTDTVVSNVETRVLKNEKGEPVLLYAFANEQTVVISTRLSSLKYVLDKLLTVRTIQ
jgi:hypothetical protein